MCLKTLKLSSLQLRTSKAKFITARRKGVQPHVPKLSGLKEAIVLYLFCEAPNVGYASSSLVSLIQTT